MLQRGRAAADLVAEPVTRWAFLGTCRVHMMAPVRSTETLYHLSIPWNCFAEKNKKYQLALHVE